MRRWRAICGYARKRRKERRAARAKGAGEREREGLATAVEEGIETPSSPRRLRRAGPWRGRGADERLTAPYLLVWSSDVGASHAPATICALPPFWQTAQQRAPAAAYIPPLIAPIDPPRACIRAHSTARATRTRQEPVPQASAPALGQLRPHLLRTCLNPSPPRASSSRSLLASKTA
jgi:hypothetical protein